MTEGSTRKKFSGKAGDSLEIWLKSYENAWRMQDWAAAVGRRISGAGRQEEGSSSNLNAVPSVKTDIEKITELASNLVDQALVWIEGITVIPASYNEFKALLQRQFGEDITPNEKIHKLITTHQEKDESIKTFIRRMVSFGNMYGIRTELVHIAIQCNCLLNYTQHKSLWRGEDFSDWEAEAYRYEGLLEDQIREQHLLKRDQDKRPYREYWERPTRRNDSPQVTCYQCGESGHTSFRCIKNPRPNEPNAAGKRAREQASKGRANEGTKASAGKKQRRHTGRMPKSLYVPVRINGFKVSALLDSGADSSFIAKSVAQCLGLTCTPLPEQEVFDVLGGGTVTSVESTVAEIHLPGVKISQEFLVCPDLLNVADVLLGSDCLHQGHIDIVYSKSMVHMNGLEMPFRVCLRKPMEEPQEKPVESVMLPEKMVILSAKEWPKAKLKDRIQELEIFLSDSAWEDMVKEQDWLPELSHLKDTPSVEEVGHCPKEKAEAIAMLVSKADRIATTEERNALYRLIAWNHDSFVMSEIEQAGMAKVTPVTIDAGDAKPVYQRPMRSSERDRQAWAVHIEKLRRTGQIRPSNLTLVCRWSDSKKKKGRKIGPVLDTTGQSTQ